MCSGNAGLNKVCVFTYANIHYDSSGMAIRRGISQQNFVIRLFLITTSRLEVHTAAFGKHSYVYVYA